MKLPSKSYKNLKSLSPKMKKPKEKLFISIFDDESIKKFINFQLMKKYYKIEKKNLSKSKNSKINNTIYKSSMNSLSLNNINNNFNTNTNIYNTINYNTLHDYKNKVKSSSNNKIISIKYSVNNIPKKNYMKPLIINNKKKKTNNNPYLLNCKSMKKINKNIIFYNNKKQPFNLNINKICQSNQNSKTDCSTFEKTEHNSHKRNHNNNDNNSGLRKYYSECNMNKNQFIQTLIDTYENLKFEVNKIKKEKQKLEKELITKNYNTEENYIIQLQNEIKHYKYVSENYKKNCDELTIQIVHLKSEIKKFQK